MADTMYRNHWNPIRHARPPQSQIQSRSAKPKIVSIPVHFVGSDDAVGKKPSEPSTFSTVSNTNSRVSAATVIQKAVRGFLVRKNIRVVRKVSLEADAIERKVKEEDFKVRLDPRERLRVSEELMALLFRLDSVRGVRDFRKKVIGRVIKLQEEIDSIYDAKDRDIAVMDVADGDCLTGKGSEEVSIVHDQSLDAQEMEKAKNELEMETPAAAADLIVEIDEISQEESRSRADASLSFDNERAKDQFMDLEVELEKTETRLEKENAAAIESPKRKSDMIEIANCESGTSLTCTEISHDGEERALMAEPLEEKKWLREMMKKMEVENDNLKLMVAQLCETSAEQCRLMAGLSDRVNNLERLSHRKDRRKKRKSGTASSAMK